MSSNLYLLFDSWVLTCSGLRSRSLRSRYCSGFVNVLCVSSKCVLFATRLYRPCYGSLLADDDQSSDAEFGRDMLWKSEFMVK